jgi:hypothetical protein
MADGSRSSRVDFPSESPHPAWVRILLPSVGDLIFVVLLGLLVFTPLSVRLLGDAGIGWHIRTGQQILVTHTIPRVDSFSSTMGGKPWFAWEWLYDMAVGALERSTGLNGVVWFTAVVIAAVFAGTFRLLVSRGAGVFLGVVLVLLAASASMIHFLARPHVVSWLFTLVWFWILDSSEREDDHWSTRCVWLLPVLMLVWVNVHGGFLVGFALLGIYWVGAVWEWFCLGEDRFDEFLSRLRTRKRLRDLTVASILTSVATFVNPYGWGLHVHIYRYLSSRFLMDHIQEFQSPNFHGVAERCFAGLVLVALVALAARSRKVRTTEGLVILLAVYSGLLASRNIPVSSLLLVLVSGPLLAGAVEAISGVRSTFFGRMTATESSLRGHWWAMIAVLATGVIAVSGGKVGSRQWMDAHFDGKKFPVEAVSFLEKDPAREPVLSPDSWGGYLIYRLYPRTLVAVDDRHDFYGEEFLKSYLKMMQLQPGWEDFLREHGIRRALLPKGASLANMLAETPGWRVVYSDDVAVLFEQAKL